MKQPYKLYYDVVVIGGGNAAICAALSAREKGATVILVEKATKDDRGGNCPYTGGGFRFIHNGIQDLLPLVSDPSILQTADIAINPYTEDVYRNDMLTATAGMTDPALLDTLISKSYSTVSWMVQKGIEFDLGRLSRIANKPIIGNNRVGVSAVGGGKGLIDMHYRSALRSGIDIVYQTKMIRILENTDSSIKGVLVEDEDGITQINTAGTILACGGFEANQEMRLQHLGKHWKNAKVRGSKHNTGDGHIAALSIGASTAGQWSGYHGTPIDLHAPDYGCTNSVDRLPRRSYPYGIMLNILGKRFVDEGKGFAKNTFVNMANEILKQPKGLAFQVFDAKTKDLLEERYGSAQLISATTIDALCQKLKLEPKTVKRVVQEFNYGVQEGNFDPWRLDGRSTKGVTPPKSNWAQTIDSPPFLAYEVTGGITYTFGGLKINTKAQVLNTQNMVIPRLYAAGEIVGGFFYFDSLRASGLMHGAVFGKIAGCSAAKYK